MALAPFGLEVADPRAGERQMWTVLSPNGKDVGSPGRWREVGRPGRWRRERATVPQLNALSGLCRYLRWWRGGDEAKKRIKGWIEAGRITGRGDVSDLIGLLRWLRDYSQPVRQAAVTYGWPQAMAAYQWPDVELPVQVPTLNDDEMTPEVSERAEQEAAVAALQVWLNGGGR